MHINRLRLVVASVALASAAACGADGTAPRAGPPARVDIAASPTTTVGAGTSAGAFTVRVVDAAGLAVSGASVAFSTTGAATAQPTQATTDASGQATTQVTVGSVTGAATVRATVTGTTAVSVALTVVAGPATKIVVNPKILRLVAVGDTARIAATAQDQYGNLSGSGAITYSVVDATLVSVDQSGLIRALRAGGNTFVISASNGRADTTVVTVLAPGSTTCTGLASAMTLPVGGSQVYSGTQYGCVTGTATGAEFAVVAFNSSTDQTASLSTSVMANGVGTAPSPFTSPLSGNVALRASVGSRSTAAPQHSEQFHLGLLEQGKQLSRNGGLSRARSMRGSQRSMVPSSIGGSALRSGIPASAAVGDIITLNVSGSVCTGAINHAVRVAAVGTKSIILADTLNPTGGFVDSDYQRFAATFDTLVYPLDVNAFGAPSDFDNNGKVAIIFTRTVNELVDASSGYFVGGFFNPRDLFPKVAAVATDNCAGSNEGEMFYMLVPAPGAGINNVTHTTGFVDSLTMGIIAHEFQHLINAGRRMYVNTSAQDFEDVWLNEGLSHIAEELLYYRQSGFAPRQNLTDSTIRVLNRPLYGFWKSDASSNFTRFLQYLRSPGSNTLYSTGDELATRGAIWAFLRYGADQLGTTDGAMWQRMVNSTVTGLGTITLGFVTDPLPMIRDWNVANFMDDRAGNTNPKWLHPSWDYHNIYTNTYLNMPTYPLRVTDLTENVKTDFVIRGGSSSYARFSVPAGKEGLLTFTSGGGLPTAPLQFVVVRTK